MVRADQFALATRIIASEFSRIEAGVSHIAAAAPGDANLLKNFGGFFQNDDFSGWVLFGITDGREKTGCAATDNGHAPIHVSRETLIFMNCYEWERLSLCVIVATGP